jgi:2-phosphosulfolactate phosphatase
MNIEILKSVDDAPNAKGLAVIIDVLRAFSVEAYIFANGGDKIIPVLTLEEALQLKKENPDYILVGERGGVKPEGFDFGNSPTEVQEINFSGKTIIHTTSNGTKGLINAVNADVVLAGSFLVAESIIRYFKKNNFEIISFVSTSPYPDMDNEDLLMAYYVSDLLNGKHVDESAIKVAILNVPARAFLINEAGVRKTDIEVCLEFNKFDFVIKKVVEGDRVYLIKENI